MKSWLLYWNGDHFWEKSSCYDKSEGGGGGDKGLEVEGNNGHAI